MNVWAGAVQRVGAALTAGLEAYGALLFLPGRASAIGLVLATLVVPRSALAGALALVVTAGVARGLDLAAARPLALANSLLVGLALGAHYALDGRLALLLALSAVLGVLLSALLPGWLWRLERLPALSLPFVLVAWLALSVGGQWLAPQPAVPWSAAADLPLPAFVAGFGQALGAIFFTPQAGAGLLVFAVLLAASRYLALVAVLGYGVVAALVHAFPAAPALTPLAFNAILASLAVGVYSVPSPAALVLAAVAAALAAVLSLALQAWLAPLGLPVLAAPFLLASWLLLAGLAKRSGLRAPQLLARPELPERSLERTRLAACRNGDGLTVLLPPFFGSWQVYQGFHGPHTHQPPWEHALDFHQLRAECSYVNDGSALTDYFCFGQPVCAPAAGQVVALASHHADNPPGQVDTEHNWGNHLLLRLGNGRYALLAHLQQHGLLVAVGDWVWPGQVVAACGNSGRSPQPHLHLQVQELPALGSATVPFTLSGLCLPEAATTLPRFLLLHTPDEGDTVVRPILNLALRTALALPPGACLHYRWRQDTTAVTRQLRVELTLTGQQRLVSDSGASAAFIDTGEVLAFYDRQGGADAFLDAWLLAVGLSPYAEGELAWADQPALSLLPCPWWQRLLIAVLRPFGGSLRSRYQREWSVADRCWQQHGQHRLSLLPGVALACRTEAWLCEAAGVLAFELQTPGGRCQRAELLALSQGADHGIPAWVQTVTPLAAPSSSPESLI